MTENYVTKIELGKEVKRLDEKNEKQDIEIKENSKKIALNDIQTGQLEVIMARIEKTVDKLANNISKFGYLVVGSLVFPIIVAAIVFAFSRV